MNLFPDLPLGKTITQKNISEKEQEERRWCLLYSSNMTIIIGHRAVGAKETSLEDFQKALDLGLEMVEFDLRMSREGELIVFHGPPGAEGKNIIRSKSVAEIQRKHPTPLFEEVIDICKGKILFDIEIKEGDILPNVLRALGDWKEGHIITSFLDSVVLDAKEAKMTAGLILGMHKANPARRLSEIFPSSRKAACRADFLLPEKRILRLSPWKKPFSGSIVWGVNSEQEMASCFLNREIAGIITDHPEKALRLHPLYE